MSQNAVPEKSYFGSDKHHNRIFFCDKCHKNQVEFLVIYTCFTTHLYCDECHKIDIAVLPFCNCPLKEVSFHESRRCRGSRHLLESQVITSNQTKNGR